MMSFKEQVILIIYFLIFGMFLGAMFDILHYFLGKLKLKLIISYIIEFIYWIGLVITSCLYMLKVSEGYLTIYAFFFFFIGFLIYLYLLREDFKKNLDLFVLFVVRVYKKSKKTIIFLIYPKEVFVFIFKIIRKIARINRNIFIKIFSKIKKIFKGVFNGKSKKTDSELTDSTISSNI